jgi:hypothetical protein
LWLQERSAIIHRFREKRKRRVWKKKIRYFCRKNLADRRVRVKGRFVKSAAKAPGASGASTSSTGSDQSPSASTNGTSRSASGGRGGSVQGSSIARPSHQRTHSGSGDGTDVSDLTGVTYSDPRAPRPAGAKGVRSAARQALTSPGSDEEDDDDEDDEEEEADGDDGNYSMEVVIGSNSDAGSSGTGTSAAEAEKKPRLLKLVLTSSAAAGGHADSAPHSAASSGSNGKLVFRAPVKSEPSVTDSTSAAAAAEISRQDLSGVDILASLAAQAASESDPDDLEDGDGDVFTAERDLMRLPSAKRIRRHSIAY